MMSVEMKKSYYKYCIVPLCTNTTHKAGEKLFFSVPKDPNKRKSWLRAMKRDDELNPKLSSKSSLWCCEDHFSIEEDMENYLQWILTKNVQRLKLKAGTVPHRFECQSRNVKSLIERQGAKRKKHFSLIGEALAPAPVPSPSADPTEEATHVDLTCQDYEAFNGRPYKGYIKSHQDLKSEIKKSIYYHNFENKFPNYRFTFRENSKQEIEAMKNLRKKKSDTFKKMEVDQTTQVIKQLEYPCSVPKKLIGNTESIDLILNIDDEAVESRTIEQLENPVYVRLEKFKNVEEATALTYSTDSPASKNCTNESESSIKIKSEPIDDSYQASPEIQEMQDERPLQEPLQETGQQFKRRKRRKRSSTPVFFLSSSQKTVDKETSLVKTELPDPLTEVLPSISQKVLSKPGPKCKKQLHSSVVEKKVPNGSPMILPKQTETCSVQRNSKNFPVLLPKQSKAGMVQNSPVMLVPATSQNTVGSFNGLQSFFLIMTPGQGSSNLLNNQESSQVQLDRSPEFGPTNSSLVSTSHIESPKLLNKVAEIVSQHDKDDVELENASKTMKTGFTNLDPICSRQIDSPTVSSSYSVSPELYAKHEDIPSLVNMKSDNSIKRMETDHNLNEGTNQICSPELRGNFESNLQFQKSVIEHAKKQILEDISKNSQDESDDLLFLRSLLPFLSKIPDSLKLRFRNRIQEVVDEFVAEQP